MAHSLIGDDPEVDPESCHVRQIQRALVRTCRDSLAVMPLQRMAVVDDEGAKSLGSGDRGN